MEQAGENSSGSNGAGNGTAVNEEADSGPGRALTLHLLRMFETRMDAAGIAIDTEIHAISARVQLKVLAGGAWFLAAWAGIVLLAIALPEPARIPVLAGVVVLFVIAAIWAQRRARALAVGEGPGSMRWFLEGLKLDLEVLMRTLTQRNEATHKPQGDPPGDIAN